MNEKTYRYSSRATLAAIDRGLQALELLATTLLSEIPTHSSTCMPVRSKLAIAPLTSALDSSILVQPAGLSTWR